MTDIAIRAKRVASVAALHADDVDRQARFPAEAVTALKAERLIGMQIPMQFGGESASLSQIAEVCFTLSQACSAAAMVFAMHQIKVASLVSHGLDSEWHCTLMERVARDQLLFASATTEGGIGGDLRNSLCAVETAGDVFHFAKDATVISYGAHADVILATGRRHPEASSSDQVLVALMKGQMSLERTSTWDTLGMRGTCSDGFKLEARDVPVAQILPKPFAEIAAQSMLAWSHLLWSSVWFGIASHALDRARAYVQGEARRRPGQVPPGALRLAEAANELQAMKATVIAALKRYEAAQGDADELGSIGFAVMLNNVKTTISDKAVDIVQRALGIVGLSGYKNGTPFSLGRQLRDVLSAPLMINNDRILANTANLLLVQKGGGQLLSA
ncbi:MULTISPECIES: acyl-CoA dehydrogenase family protein [Methylobacterium]|uniref:Cyclohex-1-ene-1-carbonyl-CoA dehydrogenase n=1 Tax=Methylobacterium bullatum TaxID=570505 RepID=A0AAV4ZA77_9HYPH|nr:MULTISPECIES: acyl-CoA dehydrogenase family protein [Methylobacterium]MBD8904289.1 acyl-CoA dehydrogenase [Methylobacterium bullatum]TXN27298.1 acyl-CoA dehydrogenase [Methylobacterium sp. WL19]GJD40457.1 Cyclohex-1-ene-1-carbonyl-CoA dehydrogenase [Methylobacterium bullatum]